MINGQKIVVVMPAYNAEKTLEQTYTEIPFDIVDHVILTDDCSKDDTVKVAQKLGIEHLIIHDQNKGYGGNQKTCYDKALEIGGDIIVMVHPDYQYTPKLIHSICYMIANEVYPVVCASRILGKGAIKGGMPIIKYIANRALTLFQNILLNQKLSEYHTGFRAFSKEVLEKTHYQQFSDDFIFDNEMLAKILYLGYDIGEISCSTKYFEEASSISLSRSTVYGFGVIRISILYRLAKWQIFKCKIFKKNS
ncbi:MAG TPA: glycosyltransferase family 2 protein [Bacteroidales bacterium]|nr:glycosyltransferase family 2 protein [Bacteroidales bacterium]HOH21997.1 glycosyltransferase family 2 protein [Bacteroidales bacterium]HPZ03471.1 glycosyltransferase family 2 protein [Bacteroidales bacterium]HQB74919.1 glycosyltransferase family 2 protein [Bacteroidales bacterium]